VYHENATRSAVKEVRAAVKTRSTDLYEVSPCQQKAYAGISSIEGIESSKFVESESPESSRTSKVRSMGMSIFKEEGASIAAKETDRIDLISFFRYRV
jgi:hypothetical protein